MKDASIYNIFKEYFPRKSVKRFRHNTRLNKFLHLLLEHSFLETYLTYFKENDYNIDRILLFFKTTSPPEWVTQILGCMMYTLGMDEILKYLTLDSIWQRLLDKEYECYAKQ